MSEFTQTKLNSAPSHRALPRVNLKSVCQSFWSQPSPSHQEELGSLKSRGLKVKVATTEKLEALVR